MTPSAAIASVLASSALALARRFSQGASLWCFSPCWPHHARHVAVEFVHPVGVGARALPAVAFTANTTVDAVAELRPGARLGDALLVIAPADDPVAGALVRRGPAWGLETFWLATGSGTPKEPADHVVGLVGDNPILTDEAVTRSYHLLWELTHVCFEHPGLLTPREDVPQRDCPTCADEARLGEVISSSGGFAEVLVGGSRERVDVRLLDEPSPGELVLVHAGCAINTVEDSP